MHAAIFSRREDIAALCRQFGVKRLDLFGSAAEGSFDPLRSDFDFLVDLGERPSAAYVDAYFGLHESLEQLLGRPVDLVTERSVTNPICAKASCSRGSRCMAIEAKAYLADMIAAADRIAAIARPPAWISA